MAGPEALRGPGGIPWRGPQATRLDAFVDAAFAFSVTLLVISVDTIPDSRPALVQALKSIPSFAACFAMIAMFWAAHARWSRRYGLDDPSGAVLSLALVFTVLVYVYPLRLQFGVFFAWASGGWLPYPMAFGEVADVSFMFLVYGLAFATMSLCMLGLYLHAWRRREALGLDGEERAQTLGEVATFGYFVLVALASIALAVATPPGDASMRLGLPGMLYATLGLTGLVHGLAVRRARAAAGDTSAASAAAPATPPAGGRGVLVTGTDTGVGKSLASVGLLHALRARGLRAVGMKPVAAGCEPGPGGFRNDDALALQAASDPRPAYADVNPWALPEPTAPQLAARAASAPVALPSIVDAHARLAGSADVVVVEGAGGWLSPLADGVEHADLSHALGLPVVLVVGLRLGCLNHARLSARAIADDGCQLLGWVASAVEPDFDPDGSYLALLAEALPVPCLGVIPNLMQPGASALAALLEDAAAAVASEAGAAPQPG